MIIILITYFVLLLVFARFTSSKGGNDTFYRGERRSSWWMVAYGMVGASVSGVSFVSVPGMVMFQDMTYLQTCLGFILGYFVVAYVLLPLYYRLNLTSIYELLEDRKIAAAFFIMSDLLGSGVKFFLVCTVLQMFVFDELGLPFLLTVPLMVGAIWLYTRRGGVRTLVYTDVLQTTLMLAALAGIMGCLYWGVCDFRGVCDTPLQWRELLQGETVKAHLRIFEFTDFVSTQNFWKQFLSGAFIVVVMTGLNQNMMQKNLTCKTLREAQKDMVVSGFLFLPVNFLFLLLGVMLVAWTQQNGLALPEKGDDLLPMFVSAEATLAVKSLFVLGIVSAAFSSADSSLTALTTSFCVDIARRPDDERLRKRTHIAIAVIFVLVVYALRYIGTKSLIDLVYVLVSYTYGPLLGLFAYHLTKTSKLSNLSNPPKYSPSSSWPVLLVCCAAPVLCYALNAWTTAAFGYRFGYELLLLNGLLTYIGLRLTFRKHWPLG